MWEICYYWKWISPLDRNDVDIKNIDSKNKKVILYLLFYTKNIIMKIEWTATISVKWQIVIPKTARERFDLKCWDDLVVLSSKNWIMLVKSDNLADMMNDFENLIKLDSSL